MKIEFEKRQIKKQFEDDSKLIRRFGIRVTRGIQTRMHELRIVDNLDQISHLPPARLHLLSGEWNGYFAVNVTKNVRLIFRGLDRFATPTVEKKQIVNIVIEEVIDYHDK